MEDSDIESDEWLFEDGNNNCDGSSFIEDTESERGQEEEIIGDQLSSKYRCPDMDFRESKVEGSIEKEESKVEAEESKVGADESTEHDKSNANNEESLKSVAETNFKEGKGDNVQEDIGGIFGNIFKEIGSQEEEDPREISSRAKSDGFTSPKEIPDLNNPLPLSDPICRPKSNNKTTGMRAFSVKFKDIINATNQGKKNSKSNKQAMKNHERLVHGGPPDVIFMRKLKKVKVAIKKWRKDKRDMEALEYQELLKKIDNVKLAAEERCLESQEREDRRNWILRVNDLDNFQQLAIRQKAKMK
ncbi:hypothetical protein L2E82_09127 [Cichorium intybus]|uniref:Uncharacterized protein n=1 Tax=Cichorium intybus TaxID=13427 RepID=A0ACB9G8L3_CICIN|nr:hypothetical protein L2E82_09127 [Cichorium intybus]